MRISEPWKHRVGTGMSRNKREDQGTMKIDVVEQGTFKEGKWRNRKWETWNNLEEDLRNRKLWKQKGGTGNF